MSFGHAWLLLVACLPLFGAWLARRRTQRAGALWLKALALFCVLLALAEPRLSLPSSKMAITVLADTSASVTDKDLMRASQIAGRIERDRGRHLVRVVPFARETRSLEPTEGSQSYHLKHTPGEQGLATDLEAAIREAIASFPSGSIPRLVLISDGKENLGSVARASWLAKQLGIPIDVFPLSGRAKPALSLESVEAPSFAYSGEKVPLELIIRSAQRTRATLRTYAEGKTLGSAEIMLEPGANRVHVNASLTASGAVELTAEISAEGLGEVRFSRALSLRRPKVLLVSSDTPFAEEHLIAVLRQGQFDVERAGAAVPDDLSPYQLIVLNNWDFESMPEAEKVAIESFVRRGGGLLVIGGERNIYVEQKTKDDPLNRTLPATLAPPRSPEGTCVVLIIDKSSSMEGRKIELARVAASGVVEHLRPIDRVGVLIFDNSFQWAVPLRRAEDRGLIKRLIAGIVADGGTQIAPALTEAYRRILPERALFKHIVLLTDGISEEGDSLRLAQEAAQNRVTISTVGIGQDVNRAYLEKVALNAKGKAYFMSDPSGLEQVLLRDVMEHTGSTVVEGPVHPIVRKQTAILENIGMEAAPPLHGYTRFIAKPAAETILAVDRKDPLLVRWQYGLGRAAVFASDAKSRWAADWVRWKGFDKFWANLIRDLLPRAQQGETSVDYDSAQDALVANYRMAAGFRQPGQPPDIFVFGPQGFQRPVKITKAAEGVFQARVPVEGRQGFFRLRPLVDSRAFPEIGYYREVQELNDYGSDSMVLQRVAEFTGGRFQPDIRQIFDPTGRTRITRIQLWPALLGLAIVLNLVELVIRKWNGIVDAIFASK
jgi:uncharacterized membrane protein